MQVHKLPSMIVTSTFNVHLSLPNVDEILCELVSIVYVISTSSPDPLFLKIFWSSGLRASTGSQLAVSTSSRDTVHNPGGSHCIGKGRFLRGNGKDGTKNGRILHCGTVPPVVLELKLALGYAVAGTAAYVHHVVGVEHAELLLPAREAGDLVAEAGCTVAVFGTQHEEVRMLQRAHTMHAQIHPISKLHR